MAAVLIDELRIAFNNGDILPTGRNRCASNLFEILMHPSLCISTSMHQQTRSNDLEYAITLVRRCKYVLHVEESNAKLLV